MATAPGLWGGFAEYLYLHPDARLHPVPDGLDPRLAVLATPLANGLRWVTAIGSAQPGATVVVLGPGAHGLGCVIAATEAAAGEVILVGRSGDANRLAAGATLGASTLLRSDRDDVVAEVIRRSQGRGADIVIDVTGSTEGPGLAVRLAGEGGRVLLAGGAAAQAHGFPADQVTRKELQLCGVRGHHGDDIAGALRLMASGRYDLDAMTTASKLSDGAVLLREITSGEVVHDAPHHVLVPDH
jgi:threonine dehydrogenase-like Zn-dependent dehydrogenase